MDKLILATQQLPHFKRELVNHYLRAVSAKKVSRAKDKHRLLLNAGMIQKRSVLLFKLIEEDHKAKRRFRKIKRQIFKKVALIKDSEKNKFQIAAAILFSESLRYFKSQKNSMTANHVLYDYRKAKRVYTCSKNKTGRSMSSTTFLTLACGSTAQEAWKNARRYVLDDIEENEGYTGTIIEKSKFIMIQDTIPNGTDTISYANKLLNEDDVRINDKWGPAGCMLVENAKGSDLNTYLFFGWASC